MLDFERLRGRPAHHPDAMADPYDVPRRLVITLERPEVAGVLGTPEVIDDLLLPGSLEVKIVIGSMSRPGLQRTTFELDDRVTGYDTATLGDDPSGDPEHAHARWETALDLPGVRGLVVGRALLYPPDGDVAGAVDAADSRVRTGSPE